ncbi:MAG: CoA transferase [Gammaproteobacteria bacterium]|nr:CoA transferase [Gammaproteobacteria bacterium]
MRPETPLAGIRIVDLSRNVAGPYASYLLAQFGADVVKVEPPGGDPSRRFGPFPDDVADPECSGLFLHLNRNKRSVVLDAAEDGATIRRLAADADILIEDFAPGDAARWGWGFDVLSAANPALVVTSITPFGQTGPYRDYRGSELTLQAIGGPLVTNGHAEREPLKLGGHYAHYHAGITAALATMMGLRRAESTGAGDWIDVAVFECQAGCRDRRTIQITSASYTGKCGGRLRTARRTFGIGVRRCADGYVNIMGAGVKRLPRLLDMIDAPAAEEIDPLNVAPDERERLEDVYSAWLAERPKREAVQKAQAHGLLAGAFHTIAEVVADPHYADRGAWDEVDHPRAGRLTYPGRPFTLSAGGRVPPERAPLLNEHADEVLAASRSRRTRQSPSSGELPLPLAGIRVAEITVVWAGPHVTQLLAEWGADVVRIEPANRVQPFTRGMEQVPDPQRVRELIARGAPVGYPDGDPGTDPWNRNASFNSHARNKRSMTCDIMTPEGREAVLRLARECDVLVENNVPETIDKAGLDYASLKAVNPRLVMLRMPAFALDGPYRNFRAFGLHVEAMVGHTLLRGYPDAGPELLSESLASDGISGVQGALAVMLALRQRERTGHGMLIEMPLTEGFLPVLGEFIMDATMNGRDTPPQGNAHRRHAPHNVYRCQGDDNWIALDVGSDAEFAALCDVLGLGNLAADTRFASQQSRHTHVTALDALVAAACAGRDKEDLFHELQGSGVCAAPTRNAVEALDDGHLNARGFFEPLPTADAGKPFRYPGLTFRMQRTPNRLHSPPVRLGEHNREIYCDLLGYTAKEFAELEARGLVATTFPRTIWRPPAEVADGDRTP